MSSLKVLAVAGAVVVGVANVAHAGDLPVPPPPPHFDAPLRGTVSAGGVYLRGDIGVGSTKIGKYTSGIYSNPAISAVSLFGQKHPTPSFVGLGVGYKFNSWFRTDVTAELRGGGQIGYTDFLTLPAAPGQTQTNTYNGHLSSRVFMANAYVDLGTFCALGCLTPFLGAGVGVSQNTISGFTDQGVVVIGGGGGVTPSFAYAPDRTKTSLAWALHAGVGYQINQNLTLEASYRYLNLGKAESGVLVNPFVPGNTLASVKLNDIDSHDFRLGMRWALGSGDCCGSPAPEPVFAPAPMIRKF